MCVCSCVLGCMCMCVIAFIKRFSFYTTESECTFRKLPPVDFNKPWSRTIVWFFFCDLKLQGYNGSKMMTWLVDILCQWRYNWKYDIRVDCFMMIAYIYIVFRYCYKKVPYILLLLLPVAESLIITISLATNSVETWTCSCFICFEVWKIQCNYY